ncbi:MAG: hypothetical protein LBS05_10220 [Tannerellaceae bacterium]|jgi:hypothetical protein|nr:hypothetical protein [Tannerellaceae bacterium]
MNKLTIILLLTVLFFSCVDDERTVDQVLPVTPTVPVARDKNVVLTMRIPGTYLPVTYAYSENDENEIRTVDVLAFRIDSTGKEFYYKHIRVPAIMQDNGETKKVEFRLDLVDSRLVVLANVQNLFTWEMEERLLADSIAGNVTKENVMKRFVFEVTEPVGRQMEPFPMYGESDILRSSDQMADDIKMIRAITRIDILNSITDNRMTIDSVYLLHTKNKGYVAPGFNSEGAIVGTPHVPADARPNAAFGYKFTPNSTGSVAAMEREIYITEDGQDSDQPTMIVLKISQEGRPSQYYRVDMLGNDGQLLPILRNNRYRIHLTKIMGDGYASVEAAADVPKPSLSSTIDANELGISTVVFNDRYKLGASASKVFFNADGSWEGQKAGETLYSLKIHTTYSGWSVSRLTDESTGWLNLADVNPESGPANFPASCFELNMKVTPNTTGKNRSGKIRLTAGTLHLDINVTQYSDAI